MNILLHAFYLVLDWTCIEKRNFEFRIIFLLKSENYSSFLKRNHTSQNPNRNWKVCVIRIICSTILNMMQKNILCSNSTNGSDCKMGQDLWEYMKQKMYIWLNENCFEREVFLFPILQLVFNFGQDYINNKKFSH